MTDPTPGFDELEADATALDEAWLALGQLLAATDTRLNEDKLVRQVCGRLARRRAKRRRLAALALAAVALLAAGVASRPRFVVQRQIARAPQSARNADFGWHDELADDIESTVWSFEAVRSQARDDFDRARWVQQGMDELESEMELSSL